MKITRRDMLKGSALAALGAILGPQAIGTAEAQTTEPRIQLGSDYTIDDDGDNLVIAHESQGEILNYNPNQDQINLLKSSVFPAISTEKASITTPGAANWTSGEIGFRAAESSVISDDSTATFYDDTTIQMLRLTITFRASGTNLATAIIHGRATSSPTATVVTQAGTNTVEVTTSDVSGTTGTDGNLTVSIRDGVVEVENRTGGVIVLNIEMVSEEN